MDELNIGLDKIFEEDIKDPEFQKYYRKQKPYFDLVIELINRRRELNITQKELAKKLGTFQSRISKIESGEHNFRLSTIIDIAEALESELVITFKPMHVSLDSGFYEINDMFSYWINKKLTRIIDCTELKSLEADTDSDIRRDEFDEVGIESDYVLV